MINEEKTYENFGYYSNEINRDKKVVVTCLLCNKDRITGKGNALKSKTCAKCQRIEQCKTIGKENRIGRKHSEETKIKIGISNSISHKKGEKSFRYGKKITTEHKIKICESNKNRTWSEESKEKLSNSHKGKILSEEHKLKIGNSQRGIKSHRYGKTAEHGKGEYYFPKIGNKIWMRSFWEIQVANYLDENDYKWIYESNPFPVEYFYNNENKVGTYCPDFYLVDNEEYWEIKGYWREDAREKFIAFKEQYPLIEIKVLEKAELTKMGIKLRKIK